MSLIKMVLEQIVSLSGILSGFVLFYLSKEEINAGTKYLLFGKRSIFFLTFGVLIYFLFNQLLFLILVVVAGITLFLLELKLNRWWLDLLILFFFLCSSFLIITPGQQLLLSSLVFLFGLPVGTMWASKWQNLKENETKS